MTRATLFAVALSTLAALSLLAGCSSASRSSSNPDGGPQQGTDAAAPPGEGGIAVGDPATAAQKYPDLRTLWGAEVTRTCGPNNGVCHNSKQFPDMQTASGLLGAVGQRCNQIRDTPDSVDNLCEAPGDFLQIGTFLAHIGRVTPDNVATPTTLVVTLDQAVPTGVTMTNTAVVRKRMGLPDVTLAFPANGVKAAVAGAKSVTLDWTIISDPSKAPGPVPLSQMGTSGAKGSVGLFLNPVLYTPGDDTQVELGDPNDDGIFGSTLGGALIKPGDPLDSYLFLRIQAPLPMGPGNTKTNVVAAPSTEAQMPLNNARYWDAGNAGIAVWCWISGMKADGSNADGPIDYMNCDTSKMPPITAEAETASTFSSVYATIFQPQCAGPCHFQGTTQPTTLFMSNDPQETYGVLMGFHGEHPAENQTFPYITPNDPTKSFAYLKISGDPSAGTKMPLGGALAQPSIDAIGTWISQGATND